MAIPETTAADLEAEVVAANQLLATWFGTDADPAILGRVAATQAETFSMVDINGVLVDKSGLAAQLEQAHNSKPGLQIEITDFQVVLTVDDVTVIRCKERHHFDGKLHDRWTTALLRTQTTSPRFLWLTLHETPILD
ncbi:hypothetical protein [Nocardia vulneris]|uniref:hypothetical protein n=1 Tax=Nocardia vulneris TaxID=1141657 RepID=UPI00069121D6|nr:hypothetical protein [Nocardia vulneris]